LVLITQEPLAQIEQLFANSPISKINWASHIILMNSNLPLGIRYWYMKEAIEEVEQELTNLLEHSNSSNQAIF
jgi:hypothetical protein